MSSGGEEGKMGSCEKADSRWSEKKVEGEDALRTVECLRGRLLAERAASKAAKEDADLMDSKLKELEARLRFENKARKKCEKRLSFLMKKLESLNIPFTFEEYSDQSISTCSSKSVSGNSESSCISSTASNAAKDATEEEEEDEQQKQSKPSISDSNTSSSLDRSENVVSGQGRRRFRDGQKGDSDELLSRSVKQSPGPGPSQLDQSSAKSEAGSSSSCTRLSTSLVENEGEEANIIGLLHVGNEDDEDDSTNEDDSSMALVVFNPPPARRDSGGEDIVINTSERVGEVLHTLKQIKENIQNTLERRRMIPV